MKKFALGLAVLMEACSLTNSGGSASDVEARGAQFRAMVASCTDGIDDDGDGWVDADDPDCASGTAEAGYGTASCNDEIGRAHV